MLHPRARTMLLLSLPAVAIGIASSLILIVVMKIASVLQNLLWQRLPGTLGIAQAELMDIVASVDIACYKYHFALLLISSSVLGV